MTLPNRLTVARIGLAGVFFAFAVLPQLWARIAATVIFIIATATDWFDGVLARKYKQQSAFGALADPLADKLLVVAALIVFLQLRELDIPGWVIFLTIARELIIGSLRALAAVKGKVLAADRWGKWKMGVQVGCIIAILLIVVARTMAVTHPMSLGGAQVAEDLLTAVEPLPRYLSYLILLATWSSGLWYLRRNWRLLQESWG